MTKKRTTRKAKKSGGKSRARAGPVEVAQRQRHLSLLERVRQGRALTSKELAELDGYESAGKVRERPGESSMQLDIAAVEVVIGQKAAARFAGVTDRTIRRWERAGMPVGQRGDSRVYYKSILKQYADNEGPIDKLAAREREAVVRRKEMAALREQRMLEQVEGAFIPAEQYTAENVRKVAACRRALAASERKIQTQWPRLSKGNGWAAQQWLKAEHKAAIEKLVKE